MPFKNDLPYLEGTTLEQSTHHEPGKRRIKPGLLTFLLAGLSFLILLSVLGAFFLPRLLLSSPVKNPQLLYTSQTIQGVQTNFPPRWLDKHTVFLESTGGSSYLWNLSTNNLSKKNRILSCAPDTFESMYTGLYDICSSSSGTVQINDILRGTTTLNYNDHHSVWRGLTLSNDRTEIAAISDQGVLQIWNLQTGAIQLTLQLLPSAEMISWSPDGQKLAVKYQTQRLQVWDLARRHLLYNLTGPGLTDRGGQLSWSSDSTHLGYVDGTYEKTLVDIWDMSTGKLSMTDQLGVFIELSTFQLLASGQSFLLKADTGQFALVNAATRHVLLSQSPSASSLSFQISPDTRLLELNKGGSATIEIYDGVTGQKVATYPGLARNVRLGTLSIVWAATIGAWSPDSQSLALAGQDGRLHVWNARTGQDSARYALQISYPAAIAWSPDGSMIAIVTVPGKANTPGSSPQSNGSQQTAYVVSAP